MKNKLIKSFLLIFASLFFFVSCNFNIEKNGPVTIHFSITDFENHNERSVYMPEDYSIENYKFQLYYTATGSDSEQVKCFEDLVDYSELTDSSITISQQTYTFTLEAYVNIDLTGWGSENADDYLVAKSELADQSINKNTKTLSFELTILDNDELDEENKKGTFSIEGTFIGEKVNNVYLGCYSTLEDYNNDTNCNGFTVSVTSSDETKQFSDTESLNAGVYYVKVLFKDSDSNTIGTRFLVLKILPLYNTVISKNFEDVASYKNYTVKFSDYYENDYTGAGAQCLDVSSKESSTTLPASVVSSITGAQFEGWYSDKECTTKITSITPSTLTDNITVYANWTFKEVYVDSSSGKDENTGCDADHPFNTISEAKKHLGTNSETVYVMYQLSDVNDLNALSEITTEQYGHALVKRHSSLTAYPLINISSGSNTTITLSNVTLDGGALWTEGSPVTSTGSCLSDGINSSEPLIAFTCGSKLILSENVIVQNNNNTSDTNYYGGGIYIGSESTLSINSSSVQIIHNSSKAYGGGITVGATSSLVTAGGVISDNYSCKNGGGLYIDGISNTTTSLTLLNTEISKNATSGNGGGVYSKGKNTLTITSSSSITGNTAANGAGIYLEPDTDSSLIPTVSISSSEISGNTATGLGSGIFDNGNLSLGADAFILSPDNIYLAKDRVITPLTTINYTSGKEIQLVPSKYEEGLQLLNFTSLSDDKKSTALKIFTVAPDSEDSESSYGIDDNGCLKDNNSSTAGGSITTPTYTTVTFAADTTEISNGASSVLTLTASADSTDVTSSVTSWSCTVYASGTEVTSGFTFDSSAHTVTAASDVYPGTYQLVISGTYDSKTYSSTIILTVSLGSGSSSGGSSGSVDTGTGTEYKPKVTSDSNKFEVVNTEAYYKCEASDFDDVNNLGNVLQNKGLTDKSSITLSFANVSEENLAAAIVKINSLSYICNSFVLDLSELNITELPDGINNSQYIKAVYLPNTLTTIKESQFANWNLVTSITIPKTVTSIGKKAFENCTSLTTLDLSNNSSISVLQESLFSGCSAMTTFTVPSSVTHLCKLVFSNCGRGSGSFKLYFEDSGKTWYTVSNEGDSKETSSNSFTVESGTDYYSTVTSGQHWYKE